MSVNQRNRSKRSNQNRVNEHIRSKKRSRGQTPTQVRSLIQRTDSTQQAILSIPEHTLRLQRRHHPPWRHLCLYLAQKHLTTLHKLSQKALQLATTQTNQMSSIWVILLTLCNLCNMQLFVTVFRATFLFWKSRDPTFHIGSLTA